MKVMTFCKVAVLLAAICLSSSVFAADSQWGARLTITLPNKPTAISYSPDGTLLAVGHGDGRVTVWDTKTGKSIGSLNAHQGAVRALTFTFQSDKLITLGGDDGLARIWSASDWTELGKIEDVGFAIAVSRDGQWLAGQDSKQTLSIWDLKTLKRVRQIGKSGVGGAHDITFFPDDKHVVLIFAHDPHFVDVTSGEDKRIAVKTVPTEVKLKQTGNDQFEVSLGAMTDDNAMSHELALSNNGELVAIGRGWYGQQSFVDLIDINKMKRVGRFKPKGGGTQSTFSFDDAYVAIEGAKTVTVWKVSEGKQVGTAQGNGIVLFSPKLLELAVSNDVSLILYTPAN